jgi:hypothetical protein
MKNVLKFSLAAMAVATLAACGGGGSSDVADTYVGTWKSKCFPYESDGATYFSHEIRVNNKVSAASLTSVIKYETAYSDAACKNALGNYAPNATSSTINIGAKTTFLGAQVDSIVYTSAAFGSRQGFMSADSSNWNIVVTNNSGAQPSSWSTYSPFTKQ